MNLGLDREETAADRSSQSVDADAMVTSGRGRRRVRKRIHVDVPNKPTHLHFRFHIRFIQVHQ